MDTPHGRVSIPDDVWQADSPPEVTFDPQRAADEAYEAITAAALVTSPGYVELPVADVRAAILLIDPGLEKRSGSAWVDELAGLIARYSYESRNDWRISVALCHVESTNNPRATNWSSRCYGLFQVQYKSHRKRYGLTDPDQLYDAELNVRLGQDILRRYTDNAGGDVWHGLRHYGTAVGKVRTRFSKLEEAGFDAPDWITTNN